MEEVFVLIGGLKCVIDFCEWYWMKVNEIVVGEDDEEKLFVCKNYFWEIKWWD